MTVILQTGLALEGRRFQKVVPRADETACFRDVSLLAGPRILAVTMPGASSGRLTLLATVDATGRLGFPGRDAQGYGTVSLPSLDIEESQLDAAIQSAPAVSLHPWSRILSERREVFAFDVIVVPVDTISAATSARL